MKALTKKTSLNDHRQSHQCLTHALLVLAASTLFACSQPETSTAHTSTLKAEPPMVTINGAETQTAAVPVINTPVNHSGLLKNVSATVYKDANCGCCKDWVSHAEDNGLNATAHDVADVTLFKERYGVPNEMHSCHTAVTANGYVFEGHVPAKYMAQFLAHPPAEAIGLAVPGMPIGSPGMEYQDQFMPYQIMQINKDGSTHVYADIETTEQQL